MLAVGDMDGDGSSEICGPGFQRSEDSSQQDFKCLEAHSGRLRWKLALPGGSFYGNNAAHPNPPGVLLCGDIDGDGLDECIFGIGNELYCVGWSATDRSGRVEWKFALPSSFATPVVADVTGDGSLQIVVVCNDGYIYGIGQTDIGH
jgi:outer membrane protein assembly factor BamB